MSKLIDRAAALGRERPGFAAAVSDYVRRVIDAAPPLSDHQADAVAATLRRDDGEGDA